MKNTFQYLYSIVVFMGVLACSYLMIHQKGPSRPFLQVSDPEQTFRKEATLVNPAFDRLFEIEKALTEHDKEDQKEGEKTPASLLTPLLPVD